MIPQTAWAWQDAGAELVVLCAGTMAQELPSREQPSCSVPATQPFSCPLGGSRWYREHQRSLEELAGTHGRWRRPQRRARRPI